MGKSRWPTIIVAALVVAALVASGVVLYTQPNGGNATPAATALSSEPSSLIVLTPSPSPTP